MASMEREALVKEGEIRIPYTWACGETMGRFLMELRDGPRIMGVRCPSCRKVFVPPQGFCAACFVPSNEWVEVETTGTLSSWTVVHTPLLWRPKDPPYVVGLVRLGGADTDLLHFILCEDFARLRRKAPVKAIFKEKREGQITDIEGFALVEEARGGEAG